MLFYSKESNSVTQILEGPEDAVRSLFSRIAADDRHMDCDLQSENRVTKRLYPDFGMGLVRTTEDKPAALFARGRAIRPPRSKKAFDIVRLQYSSELVAPGGVGEARDMLGSILEASVRNNSKSKIGGLLCFNPVTLVVVQVLEGPTHAVLALYEKIKVDPRHTNILLTNEEVLLSAAECLFDASWGMLQSESQQDSLLDLASRLRQVYDARLLASDAVAKDAPPPRKTGASHGGRLAVAAQVDARQRIMDEAVSAPVAAS